MRSIDPLPPAFCDGFHMVSLGSRAQDTTTSLSPASMETIDAGGIRGGYPAWIINAT